MWRRWSRWTAWTAVSWLKAFFNKCFLYRLAAPYSTRVTLCHLISSFVPLVNITHTHTQEVCPTINGNMGHTKAEKCPKGMCLCWRDRDLQGLCEFRLLSVWNRDERSTTPLLRLKVWMGWRGQGGSAGLQKLVNSSQKHLFNSHFLSTFSYLRVHKVN